MTHVDVCKLHTNYMQIQAGPDTHAIFGQKSAATRACDLFQLATYSVNKPPHNLVFYPNIYFVHNSEFRQGSAGQLSLLHSAAARQLEAWEVKSSEGSWLTYLVANTG